MSAPVAVPDVYRSAILTVRPELVDAPMVLHTQGWDSVGVEVGGYLFKFPKTTEAADRLGREARYLDLIRPRLPLRVPELEIFEAKLTFSAHRMIPGRFIETADYERLAEAQRDLMAAELGRLYAALHAIPTEEAFAVGAVKIPDWPPREEILRMAGPVVPAVLADWMRRVLDAYDERPADTDVTGYFDGHGWNMAFDHEHGVLNGVYDFADGGIGPRHREFSYGYLTSFELGERTIAHYEALTGLRVDRRRVLLHAAVRALSEAADFAGSEHYASNLIALRDYMAADPRTAV